MTAVSAFHLMVLVRPPVSHCTSPSWISDFLAFISGLYRFIPAFTLMQLRAKHELGCPRSVSSKFNLLAGFLVWLCEPWGLFSHSPFRFGLRPFYLHTFSLLQM